MGNVVSLDEHRPHLSGKARCLDCKHEWVAVAPLGTTWLDCPKCTLFRGRYIGPMDRDGPHWNCHCGNILFKVMEHGIYCPNCGDWQKGPLPI